MNQVRYENCGDWLVDTLTIVRDIMVDPDPAVDIVPEMQVWHPDPLLYARMVGFMTPVVEGVKYRAATAKLNIDYPVNVSKVMPAYRNNPNELPKVDTMMNVLIGDEFITINSYNITGYASPEGRFEANGILAKNCSIGFKAYVVSKYPTKKIPIHNDWVAEDWDGLIKLLDEREMTYKSEVLDIISTTGNVDVRDKKIAQLGGGTPYREMLSEIFPGLRRIEFRADYTVSSFTDEQAKELIYKRPELLSLDEVYPTEADLPKVNFESSNSDIASVSNTGQITVKNVGKCDITATSEDKKFTTTCSIDVSYKYNTYVEPIIKFGATRDEIKQLETRVVKTDDAPYGFLIYSDAGDYSIRYSFLQGKMIDAEVLIGPDKASECYLFLNERYSIKETYKGNLWNSGNVYVKRYTTNPMRTIIWYTTDISRYQ